jgi:uncharacterized protein DUF4386
MKSSKRLAQLAGLFYVGTIVTGAFAAMSPRARLSANLVSAACYVAVTLLFYRLFRPVHSGLSLAAALASLVGCGLTFLGAMHLVPAQLNPLAFFGVYCLLIGYLVFRSGFLPRVLGVLMAFGGLGWLTFAFPAFASRLVPFNMLPGVLAESALTLWLLAFGVNAVRWHEADIRSRL